MQHVEWSTDWYGSAEGIGLDRWASVYGASAATSYGLCRALDSSQIDDVTCEYLLVCANGRPAAIVPCFMHHIAPGTVVERLFRGKPPGRATDTPPSLRYRVLFVGSPVCVCHHGIGIADSCDGVPVAAVHRKAAEALHGRARAQRCMAAILRDVHETESPAFEAAWGKWFAFFPTLPSAVVPLGGPYAPYVSAFRSRYRNRYRSATRQFAAAGYRWTLESDTDPIRDRMQTLYGNVYRKQRVHFTHLSIGALCSIKQNLGEQAPLLCAWDAGDRLVAFCLGLASGDTLAALYMGLDYDVPRHVRLYYNCLYRFVEEAESRGKQWAQLGRTAAEVKARVGGLRCGYCIGVATLNPVLRVFLRAMSPVLFPRLQFPVTGCYREGPDDTSAVSPSVREVPGFPPEAA